jgi:flavin-binding protein dodecin
MSVARVTEISAISEQSIEDAINQGINRATSTLRHVEGCHVKDMNVLIENGNIIGYKVNLEVVFVLDKGQDAGIWWLGLGPRVRWCTSRSFLPLLKRAGLPRIRFHDLRHTCATLLLVQVVHPKVVQELLGYSTIAMTLDT